MYFQKFLSTAYTYNQIVTSNVPQKL